MKSLKVVHISSAHSRYDTRIFLKECRSLSQAGHDVFLVVADGKPSEIKDGVHIIGLPKSKGRLNRMINASFSVYKKALALDGDVYHLHDPELLPYAWVLARKGKVVIFDAHEDFPKQLRSKHYLPGLLRLFLSLFFGWFESYVSHRIAGVITATPKIAEKFRSFQSNTIDINNYPMLGELTSGRIDWSKKDAQVAYVGGIAATRGIEEVIAALAYTPKEMRLALAGKFNKSQTRAACVAAEGWERVDELGFLSREQVKSLMASSIAGLVTFHPCPNHIDAQPNKMFEYMSAGLPVIGSNFELWKSVIEGNSCGICVDPLSPEEIASAVSFLYANPQVAESMGRNGQVAVERYYNWGAEAAKLLMFYQNTTKRP